MPILNPGFEDAGAEPGQAAHWTLRTFVARERIAGFGPAPHRGVEDFARWAGTWLGALEDVVVGVFEPLREAREAFEGGWDNDTFAFELPIGSMVIGSFSGATSDGLEAGWGAGPFLGLWADVLAARAVFDGGPEEDFAGGWRANEGFAWVWDDVGAHRATFDGEAQETFEAGWTPLEL